MSKTAAWYQGYCNAVDYDECNPDNYGCIDSEEFESYTQGYGEGMDQNIQQTGGIAPDYARHPGLQATD